MNSLCEPQCRLSICDTDVLLADTNHNNQLFKLLVWKGNIRQCDYEVPSDNTGNIYLTNTEIIEFATEGQTFKLQLRDEDNKVVELDYIDCQGNAHKSELIRVTFIDCEAENNALYETC